MPVKFWYTILRIWFFLSYLITTVPVGLGWTCFPRFLYLDPTRFKPQNCIIFVLCKGTRTLGWPTSSPIMMLVPFSILCYNWYFVTKIVLTYGEKKMFQWSKKTFEVRGWRPRICKFFEINRTSERSEQVLVTWDLETCRKS